MAKFIIMLRDNLPGENGEESVDVDIKYKPPIREGGRMTPAQAAGVQLCEYLSVLFNQAEGVAVDPGPPAPPEDDKDARAVADKEKALDEKTPGKITVRT